MRGWTGSLTGVAVIAAAVGIGGCIYTPQAKITPAVTIPFKGEYRFDKSLQDRPPQSVAVLPFQNRTDHKEAFDIVRKSFQGHFSTLNYTSIPLFKVDQALRLAGLDTPDKVAQTPSSKLREILHADALVRGEITHYDRIYVGVYSQVAVGAEIRMVEAKTDKELWWAKNVFRKHGGGISTTPVGIILMAVSTALNMRELEILRTSDDLFREMVRSIPQPTLAQALRPPGIAIMVHDGMRRTDRYALKAGDELKVAMEGDPRKKATFRIGNFKKDLPLREEEPGMYSGSYKVLPGDLAEEALITAVLSDDAGHSTEWADALGLVTIDTIPPAIPAGLKAIGRDRSVELRWAPSPEKDLSQYRIYRSATPLTGFQEVGRTELTAFMDQNLTNDTSYYYRAAAVDLAGNESKPSDALKATPVTPGPTPVKGLIVGEVTWLAGKSPYILEDTVTVESRAALTIESGAVIRSPGAGIVVAGKLTAKGDEGSMITFEPSTSEGQWKGILFRSTKNDESSLEYVKVTGAQAGITCLSSSPLVLNNDLSKNRVGIRVQESFSKPRIQGNGISGNGTGVEISGGATPVLEGNEIRGNEKDGVAVREANPLLLKNQILGNGEAGVRVQSSSARLMQNNIHDNGKFGVYNGREKDLPSMENLGLSPLPDGDVRLFSEYANQDLAYRGGARVKYIPIGDRVEIDVGPDPDITMHRRLKDRFIRNITARQYKRRLDNAYVLYYDLIDYDETFVYEEEIVSGKPVPAKVEVERRFEEDVVLWGNGPRPEDWNADRPGAFVDLHEHEGKIEKVDVRHVKYFLDLNPGQKRFVPWSVTCKQRKQGPEINLEKRHEPL